MRRLALILGFAILAGPANADTAAFQGTWSFGKKGCTAKGPSEERLTVTDKEARFYESRCKISKVTPGRGQGVWYVDSACSGEGETWARNDVFVVRNKGKRMVIVDKEGFAVGYNRCAK